MKIKLKKIYEFYTTGKKEFSHYQYNSMFDSQIYTMTKASDGLWYLYVGTNTCYIDGDMEWCDGYVYLNDIRNNIKRWELNKSTEKRLKNEDVNSTKNK